MVMIMIKSIIIIAIIMIITPCPCRLYATPSSLFVTKIAFFSRFCWLTASALHVSSSISFTKQTYSPCSYLIHAVLKRHLSRYTRTADFHENSSPLQNIFFIHPNYDRFIKMLSLLLVFLDVLCPAVIDYLVTYNRRLFQCIIPCFLGAFWKPELFTISSYNNSACSKE